MGDFAIGGPIVREGGVIRCDVGGVDPDAVAVDALARFQLGARRAGYEVRLANASAELGDLIAFMGLADVLPAESASDRGREAG